MTLAAHLAPVAVCLGDVGVASPFEWHLCTTEEGPFRMKSQSIRKVQRAKWYAGFFLAMAFAAPATSLAVALPQPNLPYPPVTFCRVCQLLPWTLATSVSPTGIVVRAGQVYFTDSALSGASSSSVKKVSTSGGTVSLIWSESSAYGPVSLVADATNLYWMVPQSFSTGLRSRVFARTFATEVTTEIFSVGGLGTVDTQALSVIPGTSAELLYANPDSSRLFKISLGPSWTYVALTPERDPLTHVSYYPKSVVNQGDVAYFAKDNGVLFSIPNAGGTASALPVVGGRDTRLAVDGAYLYFTTSTAIRRYPRAGGVASDVVAVPEMPTALVLDGTNIYYVLPTTGTVFRTSVTSTATSRMWTADSAPRALAVDSSRLYVGSATSLVSVPK